MEDLWVDNQMIPIGPWLFLPVHFGELFQQNFGLLVVKTDEITAHEAMMQTSLRYR